MKTDIPYIHPPLMSLEVQRAFERQPAMDAYRCELNTIIIGYRDQCIALRAELEECNQCSSMRPITPEDVILEANRNYDLGRRHSKAEMDELVIEPMQAVLNGLILAASKLRIRVNQHAPHLMQFSEWGELTEAMHRGESLAPSRTDGEQS